MGMIDEGNLSIEKNENVLTLCLKRAVLFFNLKKYEEALRDYDKIIELDDKYVDAYQGRGNALFYLKEYEKAFSDFNKAIELDIKYAPAYIGRGNVYFNDNNHEEALNDYNKAIELDKKNAEAYRMRGNLCYEKKDYELAIFDYTTAITFDDKFADAYFERGKAHFYLKEYKEALTDYNKALYLDEKYIYAYIFRGNLYKAQRKNEKALDDYKKAIELDNKHVDAYVNRGDLYYTIKNYKLAKVDYEKAIDLDNNCTAAYTGLGSVHSENREYDLAKDCLEKAIRIDRNTANAHAGLGYLCYKNKDYDKALTHYSTAIKLDNNHASAYNDIGTIYYIKKYHDRALENYHKAIDLDDKLADAHYQCGIIYYEDELFDNALDYYYKARKLYKNENASFNVSLLDKKIKEITGILGKATLRNQRIKQLMDKIDSSDIKKSIREEKASFIDFIEEKKENRTIKVPEFLVLRRWNSYTPIIADKKISKGGGYFFKIHDYGIVIDPGFNFLDNFQSAGYRFRDIDHILITHAHNDHTTDLESVLTLLHQYNEAILGDIDTHEEGTIMHDVFSDIASQGIKVNYEDKDYIRESAKKRLCLSPRRKRIRIYMTASTFKKYAPMLKLYETTDYDVILIKAGEEIPIIPPCPKQTAYPKGLRITAIEAKHDDLLSDRDSLGLVIHYDNNNSNFVLVYTGDTGYGPEIEKQYRVLHRKYRGCSIVLLAHLGGFKEYEKKFAASKSVKSNWNCFYKNHLGRLGLARLVEILKPRICIVSEFGEEFRNNRISLTEIFHDTYKDDTFFIPADIGLKINVENKICLIDDTNDSNKHTDFYPYSDTSVCELKDKSSLVYYRKGFVTEEDIRRFLS